MFGLTRQKSTEEETDFFQRRPTVEDESSHLNRKRKHDNFQEGSSPVSFYYGPTGPVIYLMLIDKNVAAGRDANKGLEGLSPLTQD